MTSLSDVEIATDFVALAIDPAIPFTRAVDLIAARVAELRDSASPSTYPPGGAFPSRQDGVVGPRQVHESLTGV